MNISDFIAYYRDIHTVPRVVYICNCAQWAHAKTYVALRNGRVCGYGVLRKADICHKMFPLYADEPDITRALFCKLVDNLPSDEPVIFAHPVDNKYTNDFLSGNKLATYLSMTRLCNKRDVPADLRRVYSVSSAEYVFV